MQRDFTKPLSLWQGMHTDPAVTGVETFPIRSKIEKKYVEISRGRERLPKELLLWETLVNCTSN